jgi:hypothetical protein
MRRVSYHLIVNLAVLLLATVGAQAAAAQVSPGSRVRVRIDSPPPPHVVIGTVQSIDADTLALAPEGNGAVEHIPVSAIGQLEVSRGRDVVASHVLIGAGLGALAGGAVAAATSSCASGEWFCLKGLAIMGGVVLGGGVGAVVGALIKGEKWRNVPLQPTVSFAPLPGGGAGVSVRIAF